MIRIVILVLVLVCGMNIAWAQQERKYIREGNELFNKQDFEKAEVEYRKAAAKKENSFEAAFNMADALYKQKKYDEALKQFSALAEKENDKKRLGEIYHNIGNTLLAMEKTNESIEAYKESLRNNPTSEATKYNLEFARHKQQQNQQNQQNQDQNQDKNKDQKDQQNQEKNQQDQNKDKQDQNKEQQNKENSDQQNKQNQDKEQQQDKKDQNKQQNQPNQQPQEQQGKISKEDAERLLDALQQDEKNVQEKVQKQKAQEQKARRMKINKNW